MLATTSLVSLALALFPALSSAASSCVVFDANWNLYVFGAGSDDVNLGAMSSWGSPSAQTISKSGAPDYGTDTLSCYLSQFNNALYLLGASTSSPGSVFIYNPSSSSWSTQETTGPRPDLSDSGTILDHDTNVFFTISGGTLVSQLDFGSITNVAGDAALWSTVVDTPWSDTSYKPTMALASNHIMAIGAPDVPAGSADIFVIHYALWQNSAQAFPTLNSGAAFPSTHGQATSFWLDSQDAQLQFAYIPDDFSSTYVITHWTSPSTAGSTDGAPSGIMDYINSTQILPAPSSQDTKSSYAASDVALVQLTSSGELYYIDALTDSTTYAVKSGATWSKIDYTLAGTATSSDDSSAAVSSVASSVSSLVSSLSASSTATGLSASKTATKSAASAAASAVSSASVAASESASSGTSAGSRLGTSVGSIAGAVVLGASALFLL